MLVLGASGGITALGDTLFPVDSLQEGIAQDFSPTAHLLIRLRVLHPLIAFATGIAVLATAVFGGLNATTTTTRRLAAATGALFLAQLAVGGLNLALLAPVWLQLTHLLVADLVWIALVLLVSARLGEHAVATD
jgi:heme A synthase